jgi:hypothetical protein
MKQEHRFVAQLFGYLAPFVNEKEQIFLSLDGEAAKKGVRESHFKDPIVPDLWLTLLDGRALRIEAKVVSWEKGFTIGASQRRAWFGGGSGAHKPTGWAVTNTALDEFYYWPHKRIVRRALKSINKGRYFLVEAPSMRRPMFTAYREFALFLLRNA